MPPGNRSGRPSPQPFFKSRVESKAQIFLVKVAMVHLPKEPDSKGFVIRVFVEFPKPVDAADEAVLEAAFVAAREAATKGYILKGQRAEFERISVELVHKRFGKPIEKPLRVPSGAMTFLMGEER
jgi:hypothetical protein